MPEPRTRIDNHKRGMELSKKAGVLGRPRTSADYTGIRKETKRIEELEEAGYRSPTWAVLRALQQINSATRIEGEVAMSAPPFFQSAGRGDLLFWGENEGPNVVIWESLQPVLWKMRLGMIVEMQIQILNDGEILVN